MTRFSPPLLAKLGAAILLLIVIRSLGEVFRLEYVRGDALAIAEIHPFVVGALVAAMALAIALLTIWAERPRVSMAVTLLTIPSLIIYKVLAIG